MKILLSAYACEPNKGSEPGVGWNWAKYLSGLGFCVTVLTRGLHQVSIQKESSTSLLQNTNFIYIDLPEWMERILNNRLGMYLRYQLWQHYAYLYCKSHPEDYDVIHHVTWGTIHGGSQLWKLGKPFFYGPCGGGQITRFQYVKKFGKEIPMELIRNLITIMYPIFARRNSYLHRCNCVLVTNQETRLIAEKIGAKHIEYMIDCGVAEEILPAQFPVRNQENVLRLLWVARLYPRKGVFLILDAISRVKSPIKLTLLGGGPLKNAAIKYIRDKQLEDRVNLIGHVSWSEVINSYLENDVFVFTSLRESFGSQLLEAMACGLPIITLDQSGAHYFVPENASIKVPVGHYSQIVEGIAQAIDYLWIHPDERVEMGKSSYAFAKENLWEKKATAMKALYEKYIHTNMP